MCWWQIKDVGDGFGKLVTYIQWILSTIVKHERWAPTLKMLTRLKICHQNQKTEITNFKPPTSLSSFHFTGLSSGYWKTSMLSFLDRNNLIFNFDSENKCCSVSCLNQNWCTWIYDPNLSSVQSWGPWGEYIFKRLTIISQLIQQNVTQ